MAQARLSKTSFWSRVKKFSMAALSLAAPTRPDDPTMSWRPRVRIIPCFETGILARCDARIRTRRPSGDGVVESAHGQMRLHSRVNGVTDDRVGVHVLERAYIEFAVIRLVFCAVADPHLVRTVGLKVVPSPDQLVDYGAKVVMDRPPGLLAVLTALLPERRPSAVV